MSEQPERRKGHSRSNLSLEDKLLVGRVEAAGMLSISCRALDYLIANKLLSVRRIGSRVLIPASELRSFAKVDHPRRLAG